MRNRRILASLIAVALPVTAAAAQSSAPNYPHKPIRIVVPQSVGGSTDLTARLVKASPITTREFSAVISTETAKWAKVIKAAGIKAD